MHAIARIGSAEQAFGEERSMTWITREKVKVNGADTDNSLHHQPEAPGLAAIAEGFRRLGLADDHAVLRAGFIVYDAPYAYCRYMVETERPDGAFRPRKATVETRASRSLAADAKPSFK
jgi:hypothetical protein